MSTLFDILSPNKNWYPLNPGFKINLNSCIEDLQHNVFYEQGQFWISMWQNKSSLEKQQRIYTSKNSHPTLTWSSGEHYLKMRSRSREKRREVSQEYQKITTITSDQWYQEAVQTHPLLWHHTKRCKSGNCERYPIGGGIPDSGSPEGIQIRESLQW